MQEQLFSLLENVRNAGDEVSRTELNQLLREHPEARTIMSEMLVNEHALISHLRHESIVSILDRQPQVPLKRLSDRLLRRSPAWQPISAGLLLGALLGVLGVRMVMGMPVAEAVARQITLADHKFSSLDLGLIPNRFPVLFGEWSGDPAEVIERADGNRELRFLRTANIAGAPSGLARSCDVFQLIDLQPLREQCGDTASEQTTVLKLSASFRQENPPADLPDLRGVCRISLFQAKPESIAKHWPGILRDAVAVGGKAVRLGVGGESRLSASCILPPEATVAVISVSMHAGTNTGHAVGLGDSFVSDVALTAIIQPAFPLQQFH